MAKVHTKVAAKDYPSLGIAKGDTYYKWSLRPSGRGKGVTYRSKTYPKRQQLTSSDFLRSVYDIEDQLGAITAAGVEEGCLDDIILSIRDLSDEQQEKLDNMGDSLAQGATGQLIEERKDALESWADDLEQHANDIPDPENYGKEGEAPEEGQDSYEDYVQACEDWVNGLDTGYPG